jgi:hypothetical protein
MPLKSVSRPALSHFLEVELFRLMFLVACLLYIWFQSLFLQTSHHVLGDRHIFGYSWVGIALGFGFNIIPLGAAWFLWRKRHDRFGTAIMLLVIPIFAFFIMPQLFMERVEVTPSQLSHRREPPHTRFNADISFADIVSAVELQYESGLRGYRLRLKNGRTVELPANTVLTAARDTVAAQLGRWNIPVTSQIVRREQSHQVFPL